MLCKGKKFRKVLNIFLCVLSLTVIFSVTTLAVEVEYNGFSFTDGDVSISFMFPKGGSTASYYESITIYGDSVIYRAYESGVSKTLASFDLEPYLYIYDRANDKRYYLDDFSGHVTFSAYSYGEAYYDLILVRKLDFSSVASALESVNSIVADFGTIITENALMLLFAIGLPVCSLGVGLLIRLKERT